jgi:FMN phosphatase YigB (HAD superfamily)
VPKYTAQQRTEIKNIVANLTIKRIPDPMIIKHIENTTGKSVSRSTLWNVRQRLKRESYDWYSKLREGEYEYLHEFKERINEIVDLQKQHHQIILENQDNPSIVQTSLAELHKLNITLSNYFDVAPSIGNASISETPKAEKRDLSNQDIIV